MYVSTLFWYRHHSPLSSRLSLNVSRACMKTLFRFHSHQPQKRSQDPDVDLSGSVTDTEDVQVSEKHEKLI